MPKKYGNQNRCYFRCINDGPLHHFPNPQSVNMEDLIRYYNWKAVLDAATQSKGDDYIYNQLRLCNRHFMDCYHLPSRRLTKNSIPTLHLNGSDGNTAESVLYNELSVSISEPTIPSFMGNRLVNKYGWPQKM